MANSDGGFYPLGLNGMYHGGIHFDAGTGGKLKQRDGVRAIADGEVVAYRLDSTYPELTYPTTPPRYTLYSTGFVLIRHRRVLPRRPNTSGTSGPSGGTSTAEAPASGAPATPAGGPQAYQPPADDVLEFYSLYMHRLDWKGYQDAQTESGNGSAPPIHPLPFWQGNRLFRVGAKAKNKVPVPRDDPADASQTPDTPQAGARICDRASGTVIGLLPRGGELSIVGNSTKGWAQIATITKGTPVATVGGGTPDPSAATGWVNLDEFDAAIDPKPLDTVVVLDPAKPFKVRAGDVVGYLGEYQNSTLASILPSHADASAAARRSPHGRPD
ncbi:hypothetical protein AB4Y32_12975 [Paraburkholderia phymatum]|uniref:Uncharacterized protein n=1 Tax=Paraburkholderia phymatum TaxID=148447 RepID=A0ACC6TZ48_9BURK